MEEYNNWPIKRVMDSQENNKEVELFYSSKEDKNNLQRENKITFPHRTFNNWIKKCLISKYINLIKNNYKVRNLPEFISVLDFGCGKGGDLFKYDFLEISNYYGIDVSLQQLKDAMQRKIKSKLRFPTTFLKLNGSTNKEDFYKNIPEEIYFDFVSAQFCIHYFFESENTIRNFLQNVSNKLIKGGYFICTYPDSNVLVKKFRSEKSKFEDSNYIVENDYYSIIIPNINFSKNKPPYGYKYGFFLDDGLIGNKYIDKKNKTLLKEFVPEYLILDEYFKKIAKEYDLEVVETKNFHSFYAENIEIKEYFDNFKQMFKNISNYSKNDILMDEQMWDCSYLYKLTAFKKINGKDIHGVERNYKNTNYFKIYK